MHNHIMAIPTTYNFDTLFKKADEDSPRKLNAHERKMLALRQIRRETGISFEFYAWFDGKKTSQRKGKTAQAWVLIPEDKIESAKEQGFYEPEWD